MERIDSIIARWMARREEFRSCGAQVDGVKLCDLALADLHAVQSARLNDALTPAEAAEESGYHADSLLRLVREGKLANVGTPRRPRFRRGDLPRKTPRSTHLSLAPAPAGPASSSPSIAAIARSAVAGRIARTGTR